MEAGAYMLAVVTGYLLGSIPTGFLVARARGIDIRKVGSGNIGATNVFRALGKRIGVFVLVADGLKGYAACGWAVDGLVQTGVAPAGSEQALRIVAGLAAILGHNFTCWLGFRGGKGIATSAGVLAALVPGALVIITAIWVLIFALSRYVSLASISASVALPFATWVIGGPLTLILVTAAIAVLAISKHRSNIQRLLQGTENRFGSGHKEAHP